jgi:hypothetical protein
MSHSNSTHERATGRPGSPGAGAERTISPVFWLHLPLGAAVLLAVLAYGAPEFYADYMVPEIGVLETIHVLQGALGAVLAGLLMLRVEVRRRLWLLAWVGLAFAGSAYIAGEEASWGQHIFAWTTPEQWQALNDQGETNLHNVSSWFDQKPRLLLELGVIIGGLVLPLWRRRGRVLQSGRLAYLVPSMLCLPTAAMALLVRLDDVVTENTGIGMLLFHRASEVQELFFYHFVCLYLAMLGRRLRASPPPA